MSWGGSVSAMISSLRYNRGQLKGIKNRRREWNDSRDMPHLPTKPKKEMTFAQRTALRDQVQAMKERDRKHRTLAFFIGIIVVAILFMLIFGIII